MVNKNEVINNIAKKVLGIDTLDTQNSDEADFHNLSVWQIKEALEKAYERKFV